MRMGSMNPRRLVDRMLGWALRRRAELVEQEADRGVPISEIAVRAGLTEDEVERVLWWRRSERGQINGGWLA